MALCAGISPETGEFPTERPVTRSFNVFFDLRLNKRYCKIFSCIYKISCIVKREKQNESGKIILKLVLVKYYSPTTSNRVVVHFYIIGIARQYYHNSYGQSRSFNIWIQY